MNEKNLIPIRSTDEAREMQLKSARKRSENAKERKLIKERILERMDEDDWDEMIDGVIVRAKESDKGFEVLRDTIGERPTERVAMQTEVSPKLAEIFDQIACGEGLED